MGGSLDKYLEYFDSLESISQENKAAFHWFLDMCSSEGLSEVRQSKYVFGFVTLLTKFIPQELELKKAREADFRKIVSAIHRSKYTDSTQAFLKLCLKKFCKVQNGGRYPRKVEFIKTTVKKATTVRKDDLFSRDEIREIVSNLRTLRDKAFVMVLDESGARTGEILNATLGDVRFDENGDFIRLEGLKHTPDREIQLVESGNLLKEWIWSHPAGKNPYRVKNSSAPLFVKLEQFRCSNCGATKRKHTKGSTCSNYEPLYTDPVEPGVICRNFKSACLRAGIHKRSYRLYNLRHTRITEVSSFLKSEHLNKFAGWKPGSGQSHIYVHLTSEDVNEAIRKNYNLGSRIKAEPIVCRICWFENEAHRQECLRCKRPLTVEATHDDEKMRRLKDALQVIAELQEDGRLGELVGISR